MLEPRRSSTCQADTESSNKKNRSESSTLPVRLGMLRSVRAGPRHHLPVKLPRPATRAKWHCDFRPLAIECQVVTQRPGGTSRQASCILGVAKARFHLRLAPLRSSTFAMSVWLLPLASARRSKMAPQPHTSSVAPRGPDDCLATNWARNRFGAGHLRSLLLTSFRSACLGESLARLVQARRSELRGPGGLMGQPDDSLVEPTNHVVPHRKRPRAGGHGQSTALWRQDGTNSHVANYLRCVGLGQVTYGRHAAGPRGLRLRQTWALIEDYRSVAGSQPRQQPCQSR